MLRTVLLFLPVVAFGAPASLVPGDPLACFNRTEGLVKASTVPVTGMPFSTALRLKTGDIPTSANEWEYRQRCFTTNATQKDNTALAVFWMRTVTPSGGSGLARFVLERNDTPYTKSVGYTAAAGPEWKKVEIPFTLAESYTANAYNFSFWVAFPNQEIEIGGLSIEDYGLKFPYAQLNLTAWPYEGRAADAPWRAAAAARIEKYRKGDIVVFARDENGKPVPNAAVHVRMKRHAFGFGTAVAGDALQRTDSDGAKYRDTLLRLFNKVVVENALKWPFWEQSWGRQQADYMLPWFAANGFTMVRGHNVIWPGKGNLPDDVVAMLNAPVVDKEKLRARINSHIDEIAAYTKGRVTEWDVINEPFTNKDVQAVLGDGEMAEWFKRVRQIDSGAKLYVNDYDIVAAGGFNLQHINGYYRIIQQLLENRAPLDGIGMQGHFDSNLTSPERALEVFDKFAAFGKDLQITEFDVNVADEQVQAEFTRDFMTVAFSHPAIKGFMIWGFWEGAHWLPRGAMIRSDWSTRPNYDVWNDLIYNQWWTDVAGTTGADGIFRTRGFLGDYEVEVNGKTLPLVVGSNTQPAYAGTGPVPASAIAANGVVNAASFQPGPVAPGEIVTIFGTGFGPREVVSAAYQDGRLPTVAGDTRVLFEGVAAPMVYSLEGQASAIVPYSTAGKGSTSVVVEYLGVRTPAVAVPVQVAAPGIYACAGGAVVINDTLQALGGQGWNSCAPDAVAPRAGDVVTLFLTGEGATSPAVQDGALPAPPYPEPALPLKVFFGDVEAQPCPYSWAGLIYNGVTQVNACVPEGVSGDVPLKIAVGEFASAVAPVQIGLVWHDEFDGAAGSPPDARWWNYDLGAGGWGNSELETYTNSTDNVYQDGSGHLVIKAIKTASGGYTSGRIKTQGKFDVTYGRIEARIKIPYGQGIWPAFWMLGNDIATAGWPKSGEIDIMENIGKEPNTVHGTVHGPGYSGANGIGAASSGPRFADDFHVYAIEWSERSIKWFVDDHQYFEVTPEKLPSGARWVYDHPFFILLNLAVGGNWPGYPDSTTTFPQTMLVDWVRVYQRK